MDKPKKSGLVVTRRPGEALLIGTDVRVEVLPRSSRGSVRLLVQAPRDVPVDREEWRNGRDA